MQKNKELNLLLSLSLGLTVDMAACVTWSQHLYSRVLRDTNALTLRVAVWQQIRAGDG